jgi:LAO/AO transport system kinase
MRSVLSSASRRALCMKRADQPRQELGSSLLDGNRRALARALSQVENEAPDAPALLAALYPLTGRAHIVGVTGAPGTGKSTLVNALARAYRSTGETVGIIAVDPTSPFSGGALLGDRVRMRDLAGDPGVFIRSMATRGSLGGLTRTTHEALQVLDAAGFSRILVETVGVGQAEVDIAGAAHTTIVIEVPGSGDDLQIMKAGVLEIADLLVVNKADREGADQTVMALQAMQELAPEHGHHEMPRPWQEQQLEGGYAAGAGAEWESGPSEAGRQPNGSWLPPITRTVATTGEGVERLRLWIEAHRTYQHQTGNLAEREAARAASVLEEIVSEQLKAALMERLPKGQLARLAAAIARRELDPYSAAREILSTYLTA